MRLISLRPFSGFPHPVAYDRFPVFHTRLPTTVFSVFHQIPHTDRYLYILITSSYNTLGSPTIVPRRFVKSRGNAARFKRLSIAWRRRIGSGSVDAGIGPAARSTPPARSASQSGTARAASENPQRRSPVPARRPCRSRVLASTSIRSAARPAISSAEATPAVPENLRTFLESPLPVPPPIIPSGIENSDLVPSVADGQDSSVFSRTLGATARRHSHLLHPLRWM